MKSLGDDACGTGYTNNGREGGALSKSATIPSHCEINILIRTKALPVQREVHVADHGADYTGSNLSRRTPRGSQRAC